MKVKYLFVMSLLGIIIKLINARKVFWVRISVELIFQKQMYKLKKAMKINERPTIK